MGDMGVNVPIIISTTKTGTGAQDVAADLRAIGGAAAQAAQQAMAGSAAQAAALAQVGASARAAAAEDQALTSKGLALLALKVRAIDAASTAEVAALRESIALEREHYEAMGATEEQYLKLGLVTQALESRVEALAKAEQAAGGAAARTASQINGVNPQRLMRTASAVNQIEFALQGATTGGVGLARSLGQVAQTAGLLAEGAQWALMATGIGAAVTVAAGLVEALAKANTEAQATSVFIDQLGMLRTKDTAGHFAPLSLLQTRDELDKEIVAQQKLIAEKFSGINSLDRYLPGSATSFSYNDNPAHVAMQRLEQLQDARSKTQDKITQGAHEEHNSVVDIGFHRELESRALERSERLTLAKLGYETRSAELAAAEAPYRQQKEEQLKMEALARAAEIKASFQRFDEYGKEIELNAQLTSQREQQLYLAERIAAAKQKELDTAIKDADAKYRNEIDAANPDDPNASYEAKVRIINQEKDDKIKAGRDAMLANIEANNKLVLLERSRVQEGLAGYQRLGAAAHLYGDTVAKAAQTAAKAVRMHEIYVQARKDMIKAKSEWAEGTASLGLHDYVGAGFHFAASAGFVAAAAAGAAEAGGGGGSSGGGDGGGAGQTTFTPNAAKDAGQQNIYLITRDPYGRDAIQRVAYELDRSGKLNRPIPISPTTGLAPLPG